MISTSSVAPTSIRIAKFIAGQGYSSRRQAEQLIMTGKVTVNGKIITNPATHVSTADKIYIENKLLKLMNSSTRLWLYHKPVGLLTTHIDTHNRPTVFANLPKYLPRVISIGRLDLNSEGLLLLTNNGKLARYLELPKNAIVRIYRVRVFGEFKLAQLKQIEQGIDIGQIFYKAIKLTLLRADNNSWFEIMLDEGKNREVRIIFAYFGLQVNRLIRIKYGPFDLNDLSANAVREVAYCDLIKYIPNELLQI